MKMENKTGIHCITFLKPSSHKMYGICPFNPFLINFAFPPQVHFILFFQALPFTMPLTPSPYPLSFISI